MKAISVTTVLAALVLASASASAAGAADGFSLETPTAVHQPSQTRRHVNVPRIDKENIELGTYYGVMGVEDFGANAVTGLRLALHVTESWFLEGTMGRSSVSDRSFRDLGIPLFDSETRDLTYRYYSVGYNLFPGEIFISDHRTFTSSAYLSAGMGTTRFADDEWFTLVFGMGLRVLPTDWLSIHFDARTHEFDGSLLGKSKFSHNIEAHAGVGVFF